MTNQVKQIKDVMNKVYVDKEELNEVCEQRLAYGFDSLVMRYEKARDAQARLEYEKSRKDGTMRDEDYFIRQATRDKMRFIQILNEIIGEHK